MIRIGNKPTILGKQLIIPLEEPKLPLLGDEIGYFDSNQKFRMIGIIKDIIGPKVNPFIIGLIVRNFHPSKLQSIDIIARRPMKRKRKYSGRSSSSHYQKSSRPKRRKKPPMK